MSRSLLAATAVLALVAASPADAQIFRPKAGPVAPVQATPSLHQPSMIDLQMQIQALSQQVQDLSAQLTGVSSQLAAAKASVDDGKQKLDHDYRQLLTTEYATCTLLYQHHWAPNGAHPTASNPYVPDQYCSVTKSATAPY